MIVTKTTHLKYLLTIVCLLGVMVQGSCQKPFPGGIGESYPNNRNINHPDGTKLQDVKHSSGFMVIKLDGKYYRCSCNLVNTTNNIKETFFISTAAHCLKGYKKGDEIEDIYFSFNFEMSSASNRGNKDQDIIISTTYKTKSKIEVKDDRTDLALLRLLDDKKELTDNAYASGWNNTFSGLVSSNISHPKGDHKKVFINPSRSSVLYVNFNDKFPFKGFFIRHKESENKWNGVKTGLETGSSGSAFFDEEYLIRSVESRIDNFEDPIDHSTMISNSWYNQYPELSIEPNFLSQFLDPKETYLNKIPGGYINDLVPIPDNETFELTIKHNEVYSTPGIKESNKKRLEKNTLTLYKLELFSFYDHHRPIWLDIFGIKAENITDNSNLVLSVYALLKPDDSQYYKEFLIYGSHVNKDSRIQEPESFGFKGDLWNCADKNVTDAGYPSCDDVTNLVLFNDLEGKEGVYIESNNLKSNYLLSILDNQLGIEGDVAFKSILKQTTPIRIELKNIGETNANIKVQAISYPGDVPRNALQLFKPQDVKDKFKSYKYHESRRENPESLFIREAIFSQGLYHKTITTGNNGGYVNLINPHYKIGPIYTSTDMVETTFNAYFSLNDEVEELQNYSYQFWIDYFKDRKESNLTYNFVTDQITHNVELIKSESNINKPIAQVNGKKVPHHNDIGLNLGDCRETRMRISVKQGGTLPEQNDIGGVGEVEDYLVEICAPTNKQIRALIQNGADIRISGKRGPRNTPTPGPSTPPSTCPTFDTVPTPTPTPGNTAAIEDVNPPTTCNTVIGDCITPGDCFNLVTDADKAEENYAINFKGTDNIISIDNGDVLIHDAFEERTVSLWIKKDAISAMSSEVIYEEGGIGNGFAIRLHQGNVQLAVLIGDQFDNVQTPTNIPINQWVNITGVFNKGVISLYIDGVQVATSNAFEINQVTQMPVHHDDAGWGGTNHTNVWDETISTFNGLADDLQIYAQALTDEQIELIGTPPTASTARIATKKESGNNTEPEPMAKTDNETPVAPPVFAIFPKPAKNHLNILLEVSQAGPLQLDIVDLSGKVVYQMQRPHIAKGHQIIQLRQLKLPAAIYVLKLKVGNVSKQEKIVFE